MTDSTLGAIVSATLAAALIGAVAAFVFYRFDATLASLSVIL